MEYCTLKGLLMVLTIQLCRSEGLSISIHSSAAAAPSQEPALPPAEVVPIVSPPSLKEVQQAVQEASEQVEARGAEEVLKELLERVVEAAMGQVEGGTEAKGDAAVVQKAVEVEEEALGAETSESEAATEAEVPGQTIEDDSVGIKGEDAGTEEKQEGETVAASEDVVEEIKEVEGGLEAAAEAVETTAGGDTEVQEAQGEEVMYEFPRPDLSQDVEEEAVAVLENTGGQLAAEDELEVDNNEQVAVVEGNGPAEPEIKGEGGTPAIVVAEEAGGQSDQETVEESAPGLEEANVEQIEQDWAKEEALVETTIEEVIERLEIPFDNFELETTETAVDEGAQNEDEGNAVGKAAVETEQVSLVEVDSEGEVEAEATVMGEPTQEETVMTEQAVELVTEEGEQNAREELQTALETSEKDDQELLVIPGPEPEDSAEVSIEQSPENQAPTPNPVPVEVETGENNLSDDKLNHGNEIITPTNDLLPHDPNEAQPTLEDSETDALAEHPQENEEEPGEVNELVEDTPETSEANEPSLEAWKIGAIFAAVFLVLETVVIIIYILKCRNKNSTAALQRACEEGCVEPEAATGGDCSDDTLPAGNGDTQQISVLDASDVASTLAQTKEQHEDHAVALSDLPPNSTEESAHTGLGPDSSQDFRTSIL